MRVLGPMRKITVKVASALLSKTFDLENRVYDKSYDEVLADFRARQPRDSKKIGADELSALNNRPQIVEALSLSIEEREQYSTLKSEVVKRIHNIVEGALPEQEEDATGFHERPADPVDAFAFVGTRYAQRTTPTMIDALREAGYDDLGILDLAIAIADANMWGRLHRLLGLKPSLLI